MKGWGFALLALGVALAIGALFLPVSISTTMPGVGPYDVLTTKDIVNLQLLQRQALTFQAGLALTVIGAVLAAASAVIERLGGESQVAPGRAVPGATPAPSHPPAPQATAEELARGAKADTIGYIVIGASVVAALVAVLAASYH